MIEDRLGQIEDDIRNELEERDILEKCESGHSYDEDLLERLSITTKNAEIIGNVTIKQVMKNKEDSSKIKKDFDQFHNELNEIRKETEELNKNLPVNKNNKQASYELKVKDAIDINLLDICERKEIAETKVYEMTKLLNK